MLAWLSLAFARGYVRIASGAGAEHHTQIYLV
jgi:hypothetical protein